MIAIRRLTDSERKANKAALVKRWYESHREERIAYWNRYNAAVKADPVRLAHHLARRAKYNFANREVGKVARILHISRKAARLLLKTKV